MSDLGIVSERGFDVLHLNFTIHSLLLTILNSGIVFPLAPIMGSGNYFIILIFQVLVVSSSGSALYLISRSFGTGKLGSLLIALSFFLYFPVYGIFWYDFHYQAMFLPLFIWGFAFYRLSYFKTSLFLLMLSGMVRYPYSVFPLVFSLLEITQVKIVSREGLSKGRNAMLATLLITMLAWTLLGTEFIGLGNSISSSVTESLRNVSSQGLDPRVMVLLLFLAPLAFLPIFSPRWFILCLPSFFLILTSNNVAYTYPFIFQGQYTAGIAPFLMIGLIDTASRFNKINYKKPSETRSRWKVSSGSIIKILTTVLILSLLFDMAYAPIGPLNPHTSDDFNLSKSIDYNYSIDKELSRMISLIPRNNPYLLYQDNLPQVLPRPIPFNSVILMGGYLGSLQTINSSDFSENRYAVNLANNATGYSEIDYAIGDANNPNFYYQPNSQYSLISQMYRSGYYGILSEGCGLILLERNYTGPIRYYLPEVESFPSSQFTNVSGIYSASASIIKNNDESDGYMFYGPGTYLFPGSYSVTFQMETDNLSRNNSLWLQVTANSGSDIIQFNHINGSSFHEADQWETFTLNFTINSIAGDVEFRGFGIQWSGTISFKGVNVTQVSALSKV